MRDPVEIARQFLFVREVGGQNCGVWVGAIQRVTGNAPPDPWCASFVAFVLGIAFAGKSPLPRTASCPQLLAVARIQGWLSATPSVGDVFLRLKADDPNYAHHTGFVTRVDPDGTIGQISGNTSADGLSSNGDRVAERDLKAAASTIIYIAYPRT